MPLTGGALIGIEGIDAVGKRTQTSLLVSRLRSKGVAVNAVAFPDYGTKIGNEIRGFLSGRTAYPPEVRHILFAANRYERKAALVAALAANEVVIVNRYTESNLAYGMANGLSSEWLLGLESGLPKTDLVLVLDAHPSALSSRRGQNRDAWERNTSLQERARDAYLELGAKFGWKTIDATQGAKTTSNHLLAAVETFLASRGRTV